jgi:glucose/arabinose dehydrogenase
LGIALHPNFADNRWLYLYETYGAEEGTRNRVVRYQYHNGEISDQTVIIDGIPGAAYHDGGRLTFGPENTYLFVGAGDAGSSRQAQSTSTLNGTILRVHPDGSIPETNPFGNAIYSSGHRNPQGLVWDSSGRLWSTEHGRSGVRSGLDEINLIKRGANYGWPYLEGDETCQNDRMHSPAVPDKTQSNCSMLPSVTHSGPDITWAPASAAIYDKTLYFGGLRGQTIYTVPIKKSGVEIGLGEMKAHFKEHFGRIRTVKVGPNNQYLYVTTSNTDGRGNPEATDDRLIRIKLRAFDF